MDLQSLLVFLLAGVVAGFVAGLLGPEAALLLVPLLIASFQFSGASMLVATHLAVGTGLLVAACAALGAVVRGRQDMPPVRREALYLSSGGVLGALAGALAAGTMQGKSLQRVIAVFLAVAAVQLITGMKKGRRELPGVSARLAVTGIAGGVVSSCTGWSGEALYRRVAYSFLGLPLNRSSALGRIAGIGAALAGAVGYGIAGSSEPLLPQGSVGFVSVLQAVPALAGYLAGDRLGARAAGNAPPAVRNVAVVIFLAVAARMLFV